MKELKRSVLVLTVLFSIVVFVYTCNRKAYAASVKTLELTEPIEGATNDGSTEEVDGDMEDSNGQEQDSEQEQESEILPEDKIEDTSNSTVADIHSYDKYFKNATMTKNVKKATGVKYKLAVSNIKLDSRKYTITWTSSNAHVALVSKNGYVTGKNEGKATIKASVRCNNGSVYTYTTKYTVTNPHFTASAYGMQVGNKTNIKVAGTSSSYTVKIKNKNVVRLVGGSKYRVKAYKNGSTEATAKVDGKTISCKVYVTSPKLSKSYYFVAKGSKEKIVIKKWSGKTTPTYKSSNKSVATVTKDGRIEGHKNGSCKITVTVDNKKLSCYVAISNKTVANALKSGYKCLGCRYSQARRMRKNYYDCSSFCWRNYSKYGVNFGSKKYAPTASEQARYLVKHKKAVAYKYVSESKLQPGDVLYIRSSSRNGRYRNIGHVAIYIGNGRIMHATPPRVCISNYSRYMGRIAVIARPTK